MLTKSNTEVLIKQVHIGKVKQQVGNTFRWELFKGKKNNHKLLDAFTIETEAPDNFD